jgi:predicted TIM-barrel fold metal-dependent hydrolase
VPDKVNERVRRRFIEQTEEIVRKGAVSFGETTALHFSFRSTHPFEMVQPDQALLLQLADITVKHDVPLDLHVEAVTTDWNSSDYIKSRSHLIPSRIPEIITALERLIAHNRKTKIIWGHLGLDVTGQRTTTLTRRMLKDPPMCLSASRAPGRRRAAMLAQTD